MSAGRSGGGRLLLAALILGGLFLMHGLQGLSQHQHPGDHMLPQVVQSAHPQPAMPGMAETGDPALASDGEQSLSAGIDGMPAEAQIMLGLCVAALFGAFLLVLPRRGVRWSMPFGAARAWPAWSDWRRLRPPRSQARTLAILCVSRT